MRTRKLVGSLLVVLFVIAYSALVVTIGDHVPNLWWAKMIFFIAAGLSWGLPVLPWLKWMNGGEE